MSILTEHEKFKQFIKSRSATRPVGEGGESAAEKVLVSLQKLETKRQKQIMVPQTQKRGPGRPAKSDEEKVRLVSMKLAPDVLEELQALPFGKGVGSKVRELLAYFKRQERKEIARARLLQKLLTPFDAQLYQYLKSARQDPQAPRARELLNKLVKLAQKIQMAVELYQWQGGDFRTYLGDDGALTLQFALDFTREACENRSYQQLL